MVGRPHPQLQLPRPLNLSRISEPIIQANDGHGPGLLGSEHAAAGAGPGGRGHAATCALHPSGVHELQLGRALDRRSDRAVDRTARHVIVERTLDLVAINIGIDPQPVDGMDALDHEHPVLQLDLAGSLPYEPTLACRYLTRLQRAPEGAGQSADRSSDDVVQRGRTLGLAARRDPIVLGDRVVDTEDHRLRLRRKERATQRPAHPLDCLLYTSPSPRD